MTSTGEGVVSAAKDEVSYPAPPLQAFEIIDELANYVVSVDGVEAWRFSGYDVKTRKRYGPIYFSTDETSRWNFKRGTKEEYRSGVLCMGLSFSAGVMEYFGTNWKGLLEGKHLGVCAAYRAVSFEEQRYVSVTKLNLPKLRLFDMTMAGALSAIGYGLDQWVTAIRAYRYTRPWAQWFFDCESIDGLIYSSRPGGADLKNIVLFNRIGVEAALKKSVVKTAAFREWGEEVVKSRRQLTYELEDPPKRPSESRNRKRPRKGKK